MAELPSKEINYTVFEPENNTPKAAIFILHGMQEHSGRYRDFANFLKKEGYAVLTYDHPGHGLTAKNAEELGYFRKSKPADLLVSQARQMALFLTHQYPDIPHILFGHSMGSFIARVLLQSSSSLFHSAILMGTGGPNTLAGFLRPVLYVMNLISPKTRSRWLNNSFSSVNNKRFKNEQPQDGTNWLSVNLDNRKAFLADNLSGMDFSNNAFYGLITLNVKATKSNWAEAIPKDFPILFLSGKEDPIGDFGNGVRKTVQALKEDGFTHIDLKLYQDMRHEILNEKQNYVVLQDILNWLE